MSEAKRTAKRRGIRFMIGLVRGTVDGVGFCHEPVLGGMLDGDAEWSNNG